MPREFLHWSVIEAAVVETLGIDDQGIGPESAVFDSFWAYAYLGAITHDAPYYLEQGNSKVGEKVADSLHGVHGEETFLPIRKILGEIRDRNSREERLALFIFTWGMISHVVVDAVFHPLINYLTGSYYEPDLKQQSINRGNHREFEVYLDWWCLARKRSPKESYIEIPAKLIGTRVNLIADMLAGTTDLSALLWIQSFNDISSMQKKFHSNKYGILAKMAAVVMPKKYAEFEPLFAFGRRKAPMSFDSPFKYRCPVTGQERNESISDLYGSAVTKLSAIYKAMRGFLGTNEDGFLDVLNGIPGPSLDTGLVATASSELKYFSKEDPQNLFY